MTKILFLCFFEKQTFSFKIKEEIKNERLKDILKEWNQRWKQYCQSNALYFQVMTSEACCSFLHQVGFQDAYWLDSDRFVIELKGNDQSYEYAGTAHTLFPTAFTAPYSLEEKEFILTCMKECGLFDWMNEHKKGETL